MKFVQEFRVINSNDMVYPVSPDLDETSLSIDENLKREKLVLGD